MLFVHFVWVTFKNPAPYLHTCSFSRGCREFSTCDCHDTTIPIWTNGFGSLPTLASASICLFSCQKPLLSSGKHVSDSLSRLFGETFIILHNIYHPVIKHAGKYTIYIVRWFSHSNLHLVRIFPCQPRFISTAAVPVQGFVDYQQFSAQLRKLLAEKAHIVHHWFPVRTGAMIRWILEKPGSWSGSLNFYHIEHRLPFHFLFILFHCIS